MLKLVEFLSQETEKGTEALVDILLFTYWEHCEAFLFWISNHIP